MGKTDSSPAGDGRPAAGPAAPPSGLLDLLSVAAVVLNAEGQVVFWSSRADDLFGYTASEALGQYAAQLTIHEEHRDEVIKLFAEVMESGTDWAGVFPIRHKDGSTRLVEFRNMRLLDDLGDTYALGLAADQATVEQVERDAALAMRLVSQSPVGLAILDSDLRYVAVNPALERITGQSAAERLGRSAGEVLTFLDTDPEARLRHVLETGKSVVDRDIVCRPPGDPDHDHAWSVSYYRLEDSGGRVLGLAYSVIDVTERHRAAAEAARARQRLALIAGASASVGTTLDLDTTARELADVVVPLLADVAAVDVLDSALQGRAAAHTGPSRFRALAVRAAHPTEAVCAADPLGEITAYDDDRLISRCMRTREPVLVPRVTHQDLWRIARHGDAASLLAAAGVHSYLAVPLVARGEVLGALDLKRTRNPVPFDDDDALLAVELAARAAVCIDNARGYRIQRHAALTLQRSLLPEPATRVPGLEIACRYQPAGAMSEIGGDWYDAIPLQGDKTALVVGDVMGNGINAAAAMGQLRTATRAFAELDLEPAEALRHLDHLTEGIEQTITTCIYCVHDPHRGRCQICLAGHLPPALMRAGRAARLLDLPTGAPLGVGGVPFEVGTIAFRPGDQLVLYTDGLVETRNEPIDARLGILLDVLTATRGQSLEDTCDHVLEVLRPPGGEDDVALLIARARP
ncbi:SpoIIE family protein phosphatase [Streptomyces actinomycinicus]|uniref:protein-serine/threonine phosphatase n=1 Tax=Streptomyces actinomycinicus TaxID=1695166 RepID=A0A937JNV0_9ACTN|nr:SpoIIE family protein phosphatase [Streptomyces actinomycinicus]MBL1086169.1 SpoIIE family protein phosphatase [Streptomyces actinomycinicus]